MKKAAILILILCFALGGVLAYFRLCPRMPELPAQTPETEKAPPEAEPIAPPPRHPWEPTVTETETARKGRTVSLRQYDFENGDRVQMYRLTGGETVLWCGELPSDAVIHYYSAAEEMWLHELPEARVYDTDIVAVEAAGRSLMFCSPKTYRRLEGKVICHLPSENGGLSAERTENGWKLSLCGNAENGDFCDALVLSWSGVLDWEISNDAVAWQKYLTEGKWCFDGYYYTAPSTYEPSGENCYYRCPASYIVNVSVTRCRQCPEARPLSVALLDTVARAQNERGFWATDARSSWLYTDYGIDSGFYDTRFNTDLMEIYVRANDALGGGLFTDTIQRYLEFYTELTQRTHRETENGGWMIPDYWHTEIRETPHTSLNHQAAECLTLYHIADLLEDEGARALADRLLRGIEDTADGFVNWDHNLHYAYLNNGTYGLRDYPELTYNDLLALQRYLGTPNEKLQLLMDEKRQWMDNNSVTWYNR